MNAAVCLRGVKEPRWVKRGVVTEETIQGEEGTPRRKVPSEGSFRSCSRERLRQSLRVEPKPSPRPTGNKSPSTGPCAHSVSVDTTEHAQAHRPYAHGSPKAPPPAPDSSGAPEPGHGAALRQDRAQQQGRGTCAGSHPGRSPPSTSRGASGKAGLAHASPGGHGASDPGEAAAPPDLSPVTTPTPSPSSLT